MDTLRNFSFWKKFCFKKSVHVHVTFAKIWNINNLKRTSAPKLIPWLIPRLKPLWIPNETPASTPSLKPACSALKRDLVRQINFPIYESGVYSSIIQYIIVGCLFHSINMHTDDHENDRRSSPLRQQSVHRITFS